MNGEKLKNIREARGLSRSQLAASTGIGMSTIGAYERGRGGPDTEGLTKICRALNVSADYLLDLTEEEGAVSLPDVKLEPDRLQRAAYTAQLVYQIAARDQESPYSRDCGRAVQHILEALENLIHDADELYAQIHEESPAFSFAGSYEEQLVRTGAALADPASIHAQALEAGRQYEDTLSERAQLTIGAMSRTVYLDLLQVLTGKSPYTLRPIEQAAEQEGK